MADIPTWTITITEPDADAKARMVLQAVLTDLPGWPEKSDMRAFYESTRDRLQAGDLSFIGDRLEVESVVSSVGTVFGMVLRSDEFGRMSDREQSKARSQAAYAAAWAAEAGKVIDAAPKGHGVRKVVTQKPEPVKTKGRKSVAAGTRSLFGDEG